LCALTIDLYLYKKKHFNFRRGTQSNRFFLNRITSMKKAVYGFFHMFFLGFYIMVFFWFFWFFSLIT
jgi:hypothetical protein